jgi:hypothetical protein
MAQALPTAAPRNVEPGSLPPVIGVHQATSLQPAGHPRVPRTASRVTEASALRRCARRAGAAARGAAGPRPSRGSTLGCAVYQHAGAWIPRTPARSSALVARGAARGVAAATRSLHPKSLQADRFTGTSHVDGEHKNMGGPGAASRRGRSQVRSANLRSKPKRAGVRGHSRACARAASPCPARCDQLVASGAARSEAATHPPIPAPETAARRPAHQNLPHTATAAPKSTNGSGAPSVAVRQSCGSMASIQACFNGRHVSTSPIHHRKETKG